MKKIKILIKIFILLILPSLANAKDIPASFADLAEKLMPSVVNISTTQTVITSTNPFPFQFLQALHSKICLKSLEPLKKEKQVL